MLIGIWSWTADCSEKMTKPPRDADAAGSRLASWQWLAMASPIVP